MKTKSITSLCLVLLGGFLICAGKAGAEPDKHADAALAKLATAKLAAAVKFTWKTGGGQQGNALGAFVSKDGLALVGLDAVTTDQVPMVVTAEGKPLKFGAILKLFPEQGAALMKFDHKPDVFVPVGRKEPEIGDTIALIPWDADAPQLGKIPPVVGDIMLKRRDISGSLKEHRFVKVLSLGSGLSREQGMGLGASFAIDANGNLVARFMGVKPYPGGQKLITLYPVADIANEIRPLAKGEKSLEHPLTPAVNPLDPAVSDPVYIEAAMAMMQDNIAAQRRLFKDLLKKHPKSIILKVQATNPGIMDLNDPLVRLEDVPKPDPDDPNKAYKNLQHMTRAAILLGREGKKNKELAISEMEMAIESCPVDSPEGRGNLGGFYREIGLEDKAMPLFEDCYPYMNDTITFVEDYEKLLNKLGRHKEADRVNERIYELEAIYRRRRGEAR